MGGPTDENEQKKESIGLSHTIHVLFPGSGKTENGLVFGLGVRK